MRKFFRGWDEPYVVTLHSISVQLFSNNAAHMVLSSACGPMERQGQCFGWMRSPKMPLNVTYHPLFDQVLAIQPVVQLCFKIWNHKWLIMYEVSSYMYKWAGSWSLGVHATAEIIYLFDKTKELRKKRFESEGSETYKEVNNNIKRCMKKAKENWTGEQCSEIQKIWGRTTVRGHTSWWKTWPLWNKGKLLLSKIVQKNVSQKNDRYWTNGQNTALSCTITRPV